MRAAAVLAVAFALFVPALASAASPVRPAPRAQLTAPPAARVSSDRAEQIAAAVPKIAAEHRRRRGSYFDTHAKDAARWEVNLWTHGAPKRPARQVGQVYVDRVSGRVLEAWTGPQVAWTMARGYPGAFGRSANNGWIWVGLSLLFVLPFVNPRRPLSWLHADLLALAGIGASYGWFNDANLDASVPVADGLLAYLMLRMLAIGLGRAQPPPLRLLVPWRWLGVAALFLIGLRVGLNMLDGNVIDVGYASVVGADRLEHGRAIYGALPAHIARGDTYGPLTYLAYAPFEAIWPWHGHWDDVPAAHAAAAFFDLSCAALAFVVGRGLGGIRLGVVLAYAWLTYPFTLLASNSGTNDALPAALLLAAFAVHARPLARGALGAAAGLAKVAGLAVLPLLAAHGWQSGQPGSRRPALMRFLLGAALAGGFAALLVLPLTSPATIWERTISYQAGRDAPFSVWGLYGGGWNTARAALEVVAVALAVGLPFARRRDDLPGLAALCGAVLIAFQLTTQYWFYFYVLWALPAVLIATLGRAGMPATALTASPAPAVAGALTPPGSTAARSTQPAAYPNT